MNPLVSIIIPTRNRAKLLPRALKSILAQTYNNFECIVIDGQSTDNTKEVVAEINDARIKYQVQKVMKNGATATNEGIAEAKGKYIAFLDDDDEWLSGKLEKQVNYFEQLPEKIGLIYHWMDYYDSQTGVLLQEIHPALKGYIFPSVLADEAIGGTPTYLVRKSVFDKIGGFDTNLVFGDDGEFIRRVAKDYEIDFIPAVLAKIYINHEYIRQSDVSIDSYNDAINASLYIFNKYKSDFNLFPKIKSIFLTKLAWFYALNGDFIKYLYYSFYATYTHPFSLGKYKRILRGLNLFIRKRKQG
jgi:glycosyltransferase involved in cell wall biosynthesis